MKVRLAWCWLGQSDEIEVEMIEGASVADLLLQANNHSQLSLLNALETPAAIGVWGKVINVPEQTKTLLRDNDRVEIYQPLKADPKLARRQRANRKFPSK